jgi:glycosyltransferase involved in cell wall biosynthesis
MRILHLIQRYWPAIGGAELYMRDLSVQLAAEGHQVVVATTDALDFELFWDPSRRRVDRSCEEYEGVQIYRFPVCHLPVPQLGYPAWRRLLWVLSRIPPLPTTIIDRLARYTPYVPDLWRWLEETEEPFDLVMGMTICFEPLLTAGLHFARRRKIPFIACPLTHLGAGPAPAQDTLSRFYTMRHQIATVNASDGLIAMTRTEQDFYTAHGFAAEKSVVSGPGLDITALKGGDGERFRQRYGISKPIIASISSMSADKGTVQTVEAVRRLWAEGHDVELVLAGAVLSPFQRYLDRLRPAERERIRLLGSVDESTKLDLLAAMDLLSMPSRTESFGIVYLEAWSYGKPVIGARAWGMECMINHGVDGLLVPFGDAEALADAMRQLLADPLRRQEMGRIGRVKVEEHHTWSYKYQITAQLYRRLIQE